MRAPASHSSAPALCMPPAGAQPVRTAMTVSTSATSSGGSENSTSEMAPTTPARRGKRPLPEIRPQRHADGDGEERAPSPASSSRVRGARRDQRQDRLAVAERRAEVEPHRRGRSSRRRGPAPDDRGRGGRAHGRSARRWRLRAALRWWRRRARGWSPRPSPTTRRGPARRGGTRARRGSATRWVAAAASARPREAHRISAPEQVRIDGRRLERRRRAGWSRSPATAPRS